MFWDISLVKSSSWSNALFIFTLAPASHACLAISLYWSYITFFKFPSVSEVSLRLVGSFHVTISPASSEY